MADIVFPGQEAGGVLGQDFLPSNFDLVLYRGDYFPMKVSLKNPSGTALDLTGYTAKASIRSSYEDPTTFNFTSTINAAAGEVDIILPSSVSSTIPAGSYIWDFQVTEPGGNVRTYIAGDVTVYDEVTK